MPVLQSHLKGSFNLDSSGIAGFFGGEEAFAAMRSVHLVHARRWLGWYNSPGSYFVAKKYGILPMSTFWDSVFPGPSTDPTELLDLDNKPGWRFSGAYNGNQEAITGHLSYLVSQYCATQPALPPPWPPLLDVKANAKNLKKASQINNIWPDNRHRNITVTIVKFNEPDLLKWDGYPKIPESYFTPISKQGRLIILLTILFSLAACTLSALYGDWFSFSMILLGAVTNGVTSLVLGTSDLTLEISEPFEDATPGDGILYDRQNIIIFRGNEHIIDTILKARFRLVYPHDSNHQRIGFCALALLAQFLLQLFIIPQGELIGQVMFLSTLAMSWTCNSYLASFNQDKLQTDLLFKLIGTPEIHKISVEKWSVAVAFTMFSFPDFKTPDGMLNELMSNNTPAWNLWKKCIAASILQNRKPSSFVFNNNQGDDTRPQDEKSDPAVSNFSQEYEDMDHDKDKRFVRSVLLMADEVFNGVRQLNAKTEFAEKRRRELKAREVDVRTQKVDIQPC